MQRYRKREMIYRQGVWKKWIFSYLLVLIIPFLTFFACARVSQESLRNEISRVNAMRLENIREMIDSDIIVIRSAFNYTYNSLEKLPPYSTKTQAFYSNYDVYQYVKELQAYSRSNFNVCITMYFPKRDYIISSATANDPLTLYMAQQTQGLEMNYEDWKTQLSANYRNELSYTSGLCIDQVKPCLTLSHTVQKNSESVNVFISLPKAATQNVAFQLEGQMLGIVDEEGNLIRALNGELPSRMDLSLENGQTTSANDGVFVQNWIASQHAPWRYVMLTSEGNYWQSVKYSSSVAVVAEVLALVVGLVTAFFLTRYHYRPLNSLIRKMDVSFTHNHNEYQLIENFFDNTTQEIRSMHSELNAYSERMREQALLNRLKGRESLLSQQDINVHYEFETDGNFVLVVFALEHIVDEPSHPYADEQAYGEAMFHAVHNSFVGIMQGYSYETMEDGYMLLYLIRLDEERMNQWEQEGRILLERLNRLITHRISSKLTLAVSQCVQHFDQIQLMYHQTIKAIEYRSIVEPQSQELLLVEDYMNWQNDELLDGNEEMLEAFRHAVADGQEERCKQLVERFCAVSDDPVQYAALRLTLFNCMYTVMQEFFLQVPDAQQRYQFTQLMEQAIKEDEQEKTREGLLRILHFSCQTIGAQQQTMEQDALVTRICQLVNQKYSDCDLNISAVAQALDKNANYISQAFSKSTGEGLLNYIRRVRIGHAMELLKDSALTVEEISAKTGFSNIRTFRRAFLAVTGKQPSAFRNGVTTEK